MDFVASSLLDSMRFGNSVPTNTTNNWELPLLASPRYFGCLPLSAQPQTIIIQYVVLTYHVAASRKERTCLGRFTGRPYTHKMNMLATKVRTFSEPQKVPSWEDLRSKGTWLYRL
ncbi:hypothetical protein M404DRAFT_728919 [Pisolithus tinctorius Marx 270]|uniref:Uncharacterized protein n=1 Tax=Pisolithus tinctorius Marx 270 TaxID=870435 RepID=A0A0C3JW03_PISTI|nr:hypothetical protein M404DRAFT_728919 [Pisolithus tinctorius Marx 270]